MIGTAIDHRNDPYNRLVSVMIVLATEGFWGVFTGSVLVNAIVDLNKVVSFCKESNRSIYRGHRNCNCVLWDGGAEIFTKRLREGILSTCRPIVKLDT